MMTSPISLTLPEGAILHGALYASQDRTYLAQDILEIELANGVMIDVGWIPPWDPNGEYMVAVFRGDWDTKLSEPFYSTNVHEVAATVESLARQFATHNFAEHTS